MKIFFINVIKAIFVGVISIFIIKILFTFVLNHIFMNDFIKLAIALFVYGISFFVLIFAVKIFNQDDFELMQIIEKKSGISLEFIKKYLRRFS